MHSTSRSRPGQGRGGHGTQRNRTVDGRLALLDGRLHEGGNGKYGRRQNDSIYIRNPVRDTEAAADVPAAVAADDADGRYFKKSEMPVLCRPQNMKLSATYCE